MAITGHNQIIIKTIQVLHEVLLNTGKEMDKPATHTCTHTEEKTTILVLCPSFLST